MGCLLRCRRPGGVTCIALNAAVSIATRPAMRIATEFPLPMSPSDPDLNLVVVLETNDPFALALAKGVLEEAGIPYFGLNEITRLVNDVDPMLRKWVRLQVARDREAEARDLLASLLQPVPGYGSAAES